MRREPLEVLGAVDGVAAVLRRLRQQPFRLVPADRPDRQPAAVRELVEAERRLTSGCWTSPRRPPLPVNHTTADVYSNNCQEYLDSRYCKCLGRGMTTTLRPSAPTCPAPRPARTSSSPPPSARPSTRSATIDWSVPIDDSAFHLPPELLPLYGTAAWDAMTRDRADRVQPPRDRGALRRRDLVRERADAGRAAPPRRPARHRSRAPVPARRGRRRVPPLGDVRRVHPPRRHPRVPPDARRELALDDDDAPARRAVSYLLILAVEELLDYMNRATMRDERVHPISRAIAQAARARRSAPRQLREDVPRRDRCRRSSDEDRARGRRRRAGARRGRRRPQRRSRGLRAPRHRRRRRDRAGEPASPRDDRRRARQAHDVPRPRSA